MIQENIKKILVPLNGTKSSKAGLEMAISLASKYEATIVGAYVINTTSRSEFGGLSSARQSVTNEIERIMEDSRNLAAKYGVEFTHQVLRGDIGYNIIKLAHDKKQNFDLVVVGARKMGVVKSLFLGSTSNYIVSTSKIPVLVLK